MTSFCIVSFDNGKNIQCFCENRDCLSGRADQFYSWKHMREAGWGFFHSDTIKDKYGRNQKASPYNKDIVSSGIPVEIYCPECLSRRQAE